MKRFRKNGQTKSKWRGATAMVAVLVGVGADQAVAVTSVGQMDAEIIHLTVPALSPIEDLHFGEIIAGGAPGTVTISTLGAPTLSGVSHTGGSPHRQGVMRILGSASSQVEINIVPGAYSVSNGVVTMPVTAFDIGNGANAAHTVTLTAGGLFDVNIGATLGVGAAQPAGNYTGTFTLNADYP